MKFTKFGKSIFSEILNKFGIHNFSQILKFYNFEEINYTVQSTLRRDESEVEFLHSPQGQVED